MISSRAEGLHLHVDRAGLDPLKGYCGNALDHAAPLPRQKVAELRGERHWVSLNKAEIPGLENGPGGAHIPVMATIVQCNCGAEYRRTEQKFLAPHTGDAVCTVCGAALESWWKSTHVPAYELIERPDRKPE
jgi:hypothetical protein